MSRAPTTSQTGVKSQSRSELRFQAARFELPDRAEASVHGVALWMRLLLGSRVPLAVDQ